MNEGPGGWNMSHQLATHYAIEGLKALTLAQGGAVVARTQLLAGRRIAA